MKILPSICSVSRWNNSTVVKNSQILFCLLIALAFLQPFFIQLRSVEEAQVSRDGGTDLANILSISYKLFGIATILFNCMADDKYESLEYSGYLDFLLCILYICWFTLATFAYCKR